MGCRSAPQAIVPLVLAVLSCTYADADEVYWCQSANGDGQVWRASTDGTNAQMIFRAKNTLPEALAADPLGLKIYWFDALNWSLHRANFDGTDYETLRASGSSIRDLAVDSQARKLYWLEYMRVRRANLDGTGAEDLVVSGLSNPSSIALDQLAGKVYWTDYGSSRISRANLDGSNVETLIYSGVNGPGGLVVDAVNGRMFWGDSGHIRQSTLDGTGVQTLFDQWVFYMDFDRLGDHFFFTDYNGHRIGRIHRDGTGLEYIVATGQYFVPSGIAFVPEPTSIGLALLAGLTLLRSRRWAGAAPCR